MNQDVGSQSPKANNGKLPEQQRADTTGGLDGYGSHLPGIDNLALERACIRIEGSTSLAALTIAWQDFIVAVKNPPGLEEGPRYLAAETLQALMLNPDCFRGEEDNRVGARGVVLITEALKQLAVSDPRCASALRELRERTRYPDIRTQIDSIVGPKRA